METIALDVHAHLIPASDGGLGGFDGVSWDAEAKRLTVDGHAIGLAHLFRPEALLGWMKDNAVAHAFISVPPPVYRQDLTAAEAARWTAALNAGLAVIAQAHAPHLSPLFHVPIEHPELAAEVVKTAAANGQTRFAMPTGGPGVMLSDARYEPLWQALDAASAFIFLHPGEGCDPRLDPFYLNNLLGNPNETAIAAGHLVFGGVPERFTSIRFCLAHAGGTIGAVAGRWQQGFETARPGLDTSREAPRTGLSRFCVDCLNHDPQVVALAGHVFGEDRVLFGSDWPFPMGLLRPHEQLSGLDPARRKAIFCDNPERILGPG